jgi:hypothetical protein
LCKFLGLVVSQSRKVLGICIAYLSLAVMDTSWTHPHSSSQLNHLLLHFHNSLPVIPYSLLTHAFIQNDPETTQKLKICQETRETGQACTLATSMCPICTHFLPSKLLPLPTACSIFPIHILTFQMYMYLVDHIAEQGPCFAVSFPAGQEQYIISILVISRA